MNQSGRNDQPSSDVSRNMPDQRRPQNIIVLKSAYQGASNDALPPANNKINTPSNNPNNNSHVPSQIPEGGGGGGGGGSANAQQPVDISNIAIFTEPIETNENMLEEKVRISLKNHLPNAKQRYDGDQSQNQRVHEQEQEDDLIRDYGAGIGGGGGLENENEDEREEQPNKAHLHKKPKKRDPLPRHKRIWKMEFPSNTPERVIVLPNKVGFGFRLNCYDENILQNLVPEFYFTQTVRECNKRITQAWAADQVRQTINPFESEKKIMIYTIYLTLLSFLFYVLRIYFSVMHRELALLLLGAVSQVLVIVLVLVAFVRIAMRRPHRTNLHARIHRKLQEYLDEENGRLVYRSNGLTWTIGQDYLWLQLNIDINYIQEPKITNEQ